MVTEDALRGVPVPGAARLPPARITAPPTDTQTTQTNSKTNKKKKENKRTPGPDVHHDTFRTQKTRHTLTKVFDELPDRLRIAR